MKIDELAKASTLTIGTGDRINAMFLLDEFLAISSELGM